MIVYCYYFITYFSCLIHSSGSSVARGRWKVIKVFLRVLCAPFYKVHFWLANNLSSTVVIFLDFEFLICFCAYVWPLDKNEDGRVCNNNGYAVRPVISCLPAFWQLMQCLRCYHDTKNYVNLIDAVKACTTFPVVILFALFAEDHPSTTQIDVVFQVRLAVCKKGCYERSDEGRATNAETRQTVGQDFLQLPSNRVPSICK